LLPDKFGQITNVEKKAAQIFSLWKNPDAGKKIQAVLEIVFCPIISGR
jgi:hypothetical protein